MSDLIAKETPLSGEIDRVRTLLTPLGFSLDEYQPHVSGERYLMAKDKLVLVGTRADNVRAIIKASRHKEGKEEILKEQRARQFLLKATFSGDSILFPDELGFAEKDEYVLWATEFIPQEKVFAAYTLEEQFFRALRIFEEQESFHATTYGHVREASKVVPFLRTENYLASFHLFCARIAEFAGNDMLRDTMAGAETLLVSHADLLDAYSGYLSHTDLVPGNMRLHGTSVYLIDLASMAFGNKYEGWARFVNWALLHSPELEDSLAAYVRANRGEQEYLCFRLMRIYKAGLLLDFYARSLPKTTGNLRTLTEKRVFLWQAILDAFMRDEKVPAQLLAAYRAERDTLRSAEEIERQKEFNLPLP